MGETTYESVCLCVKETGRSVSGSALNHVIERLIKLILFTPSPSLPPPTGTAPQFYVALNQSDRLFTAIVTMEPTEGLTMSPWKLHLFTTELSVKEDEGEPYRLVWGNYHRDCFHFKQIKAFCLHIIGRCGRKSDAHLSTNNVCVLLLFSEPST